jgi:hypothetical protein
MAEHDKFIPQFLGDAKVHSSTGERYLGEMTIENWAKLSVAEKQTLIDTLIRDYVPGGDHKQWKLAWISNKAYLVPSQGWTTSGTIQFEASLADAPNAPIEGFTEAGVAIPTGPADQVDERERLPGEGIGPAQQPQQSLPNWRPGTAELGSNAGMNVRVGDAYRDMTGSTWHITGFARPGTTIPGILGYHVDALGKVVAGGVREWGPLSWATRLKGSAYMQVKQGTGEYFSSAGTSEEYRAHQLTVSEIPTSTQNLGVPSENVGSGLGLTIPPTEEEIFKLLSGGQAQTRRGFQGARENFADLFGTRLREDIGGGVNPQLKAASQSFFAPLLALFEGQEGFLPEGSRTGQTIVGKKYPDFLEFLRRGNFGDVGGSLRNLLQPHVAGAQAAVAGGQDFALGGQLQDALESGALQKVLFQSMINQLSPMLQNVGSRRIMAEAADLRAQGGIDPWLQFLAENRHLAGGAYS